MDINVLDRWIRGATFLVAFWVSEVAIASETCIKFPRESTNPVVEVCESEDRFRFRIGDLIRDFAQHDFKTKMKHAIVAWLDQHDLSDVIEQNSSVQIWMSVPESDPLAAQPRAVISTKKGNILFWFNLASNEWILSDKETAILGAENYPGSFGHRPQKILAKARNGVPDHLAMAALLDAGASSVRSTGNGWLTAECDVFAEKSLAKSALKSHDNVLQYAQVNSVYEWIADRQMAFSFALDPDQN